MPFFSSKKPTSEVEELNIKTTMSTETSEEENLESVVEEEEEADAEVEEDVDAEEEEEEGESFEEDSEEEEEAEESEDDEVEEVESKEEDDEEEEEAADEAEVEEEKEKPEVTTTEDNDSKTEVASASVSIAASAASISLGEEAEAAAIAEATKAAYENYKPSQSLLKNSSPYPLIRAVDGLSLKEYNAEPSVFAAKNVSIPLRGKFSVPIHVTSSGSVVDYTVESQKYDIGFGIVAEREEGTTVVKVR